jgi:serine/threonine-protein kinase RsbW
MHINVQMVLPPAAASVPVVRRTVTTALKSAGVTSDCVYEVGVALSEACTRVSHDCGHEDAYDVAIDVAGRQMTIDVVAGARSGLSARADEGPAMAHETAEVEPGAALMRALADRALIDSVVGGPCSVHLLKNLRYAS